MKKMLVRIKDKDCPQDLSGFEFPDDENRKLFFEELKPEPQQFIQIICGKQWFQHYLAWHMLEKLGWYYDDISDDEYLIWMKPESTVEKLEMEIKHHDWTYQYSDMLSTWRNGIAEENHIKELAKQVDKKIVKELLEKYGRNLQSINIY